MAVRAYCRLHESEQCNEGLRGVVGTYGEHVAVADIDNGKEFLQTITVEELGSKLLFLIQNEYAAS